MRAIHSPYRRQSGIATLRAAKRRAAERGETLKALFTRAVQNELGRPEMRHRVEWPLIRTSFKQRRRLTNQEIEEIFAAEDVERVGRSQR